MRHFLDLLDATPDELTHLLSEAERLKTAWQAGDRSATLQGRVLGLIFDKPSLRTRVSFQAAIAQCGGSSIFLTGAEAGLGSRETLADAARAMTQYVDAVVVRTFRHRDVETFSQYAACPVINGLSDQAHPCQALADLFTIHEAFGSFHGLTLVFVGDGNNVARSLAVACGKLGVRFILAAPEGYRFPPDFLAAYGESVSSKLPQQLSDPRQAMPLADIVYTDVWTSMGQETEQELRRRNFGAFQVTEELLALAPAHARLMHCLPARRGEEISAAALDGEQSIVFQQAGNRLHLQKALLEWLLEPDRQPVQTAPPLRTR